MKYHIVSYRELPTRLRINGLPCAHKSRAGQYDLKNSHEFHFLEVYDYIYICYGNRPRAPELHKYGPWLVETDPFLVEIEKYEYVRWTEQDEVLPQDISINSRKLKRAFDRYYFAANLNERETRFIFDYMAPTYEADINYRLNLDMNRKLLESIATFELPKRCEGEPVKILDYGVGTGICAYAAPDIEDDTWGNWGIEGLDISKEMVNQARQKRREEDTESRLLDAYEINRKITHLLAESFHGGMACFTVQYFIGSQPYEDIHRLLKPGAPFVCNVLKNEIHPIESNAKAAGLVPQRNHCKELDDIVRGQPVVILAFIKKP